jgi:hypothetical protein
MILQYHVIGLVKSDRIQKSNINSKTIMILATNIGLRNIGI